MPAAESVEFIGDTLMFRFRGAGVDPAADAALTVKEPSLPGGQHTSAHGYLAGRSLTVADGVAPVIIDAIYYPSLEEGKAGVTGDTLAVAFNKYAKFADMSGIIAPFAFSRSGAEYELELQYVRHSRDTVYFAVFGISGGVDVPVQGDMVRIKDDGGVMNILSYAQYNRDNPAVPLRVKYPELNYIVRIGPSPFRIGRDSLRISLSVEPYQPAVFDALDPKVRIFDRMGNIVALTGENLRVERESGRYVVIWNGHNRRGRLAGTGTYILQISIVDQNGERRTIDKRLVYLRGR
jgi:hypothetical protein